MALQSVAHCCLLEISADLRIKRYFDTKHKEIVAGWKAAEEEQTEQTCV